MYGYNFPMMSGYRQMNYGQQGREFQSYGKRDADAEADANVWYQPYFGNGNNMNNYMNNMNYKNNMNNMNNWNNMNNNMNNWNNMYNNMYNNMNKNMNYNDYNNGHSF